MRRDHRGRYVGGDHATARSYLLRCCAVADVVAIERTDAGWVASIDGVAGKPARHAGGALRSALAASLREADAWQRAQRRRA